MIVFSDIKKFNKIIYKYDFNGVNLIPIQIKNDLYILNELSENDKNFIEFFNEFLKSVKHEKREVKTDELILFELPNA